MAQNAWTGLNQATSNLPQLGMAMVGMKERNADRDEALALRAEAMQVRDRDYQERTQLMKQQKDIEEAKLIAQTPKYKQPMHPSMISSAELATESRFGKYGREALSPVWKLAREIAGASPESSFGDNYSAVKSAWGDGLQAEVAENIQKALASDKLKPSERKALGALYDSVMYDKDGSLVLDQGVYKETARSMRMEEEAKAKQPVKPGAPPHISYGDRTEIFDAEGNVIRTVPHGKVPGVGSDDKKEKELEKKKAAEMKDATAKINRQISEYERKIKAYEIEARNAKSQGDAKWYQDAIDKHEEQLALTKQTRDALNNGDITPNQIQWGGAKPTQADTTTEEEYEFVDGKIVKKTKTK